MNERLEEIIKDLPYSIRHEGNVGALIDYAKEQDELVQDLETQLYGSTKDYEALYYSYQKAMSMMARIEQQNKRYREAIEYVMNAKVNQYASVENVISDIKFVLSETLESESNE